MTRARPRIDADTALLCSVPGCCNRWTSNFGARYCREHDPGLNGHKPTARQQSLAGMPLRDALPPFNERAERDGENP